MARASRITSKKPLKSVKKASTKTIEPPKFSSEVTDGDLVLINRSGTDANTTVEDLAQYVGGSLELDALVGDINQELTELGDTITKDLTAKIEDNSNRIDGLETDLGELEVRVENNEGDIKTHGDLIQGNTDAIDALDQKFEADQARQDGWTGAGSATNPGKTFKALIEENASDIAALQGALVYRGQVADPSATPPADPHVGDFYQFKADGGVDSGWNAPSDTVSAGDYYAYYEKPDGSKAWGPAGSNAVVIEPPGDGALEFSTDKAVTITAGSTGFTANTDTGETYTVGLVVKGDGGISIGDNGLEINGGDGINVGSGGISIDPDFINNNVVGDAALSIAAEDSSLDVTNGTGFNANATTPVNTTLKVKVDGDGGLDVGSDGIGINIDAGNNGNGGDPSIIISGDGMSVNPDFISGIAGPVPNLQAVTGMGSTTTTSITAAGLVSTGAVTAVGSNAAGNTSSFLFKDISQLPELGSVVTP